MELIDFVVAPIYLIFFTIAAFYFSSNQKNNFIVQKYFVRAYLLRFFGGIAFGCIYAFYYKGGDTFNYFHDSCILTDAYFEEPTKGLRLLFGSITYEVYDTFDIVKKLIFVNDPSTNYVYKITSIVNILTFKSFFASTMIFSLIGFWGSWRMFTTLCQMYPHLHKPFALGCLYLPSILMWASGIMKDTICNTAVCILFSSFIQIYIFKRFSWGEIVLVILALWMLFVIKIYILICFVPAILVYFIAIYTERIKHSLTRSIAKPILYTLAAISAYFLVSYIVADNEKYSLDQLEKTAKVQAEYLYRVSKLSGGSFYTLGDISMTPSNIPSLLYKSFVVTFYRPFIWEVRSPIQLLSVLEAMYFIYISYLFIGYMMHHKFKKTIPTFARFCFLFSIFFALIVGPTSNNFGTLARYKALMLPFFVCGIYVTIKQDQQSVSTIRKI
jgi:hypothetical protein